TTTALPNGQISVEVSGNSLSADPNVFVVTLDQTGQYVQIFVNGSLDFVQPLLAIDRIDIGGLAGDDHLTVDSSNGLITIANGIHFDGKGAVNSLSLVQAGGPTHA